MQRVVSAAGRAIPRLARTKPNETALFVCDIQTKFKDIIHAMPSVVFVAKHMMTGANELQVPIIISEQYPKGLGKTIPELDVSLGKVFEKTKFSMLTDEVLTELERLGTKSVVLLGLEAHVCVQQTCLDLLDRGLDVFVVADGTSSQRQFDRQFAFDLMRQRGAAITTSESALFDMMQDAKHPKFKTISALAVAMNKDRPDPKLYSSL